MTEAGPGSSSCDRSAQNQRGFKQRFDADGAAGGRVGGPEPVVKRFAFEHEELQIARTRGTFNRDSIQINTISSRVSAPYSYTPVPTPSPSSWVMTAAKSDIDFIFLKRGFKNWHRAHKCFRNHKKSKGYKHRVSSWSSYTIDKSVDILLEKKVQKEVFISKQINKKVRPFRGHDESKKSIAQVLFLDLIDLVSKYDPTLKDHLTNGPQNPLYTSGIIQNDIIISISNIILRKITRSVQNKLVSIIADEISDCGHHEQMAFILR
ncbi:zinc finger MYM-type protein 1-like [Myzus persicae]|uniref:zinc finger MYM-type protein 1-like n=1 Tax=Myzus persicae TaxID=13164 RepID=UPI000B938904|nr:zinc finger MYM-type protein 1-like [Myzus persicae]